MALTLNQIVSRLKSLAESHKQINSFYFGAEPEWTANGEITYPACFIEQLQGAIDRAKHEQQFRFRAVFVDLVPEVTNSEGNETEALSDMHSVAADYVAMLGYYGYQDDWWINDISQVTPIEEGLEDLVAGAELTFQVNTEFIADRCQVPAADVTFETDFDMARTRILTYTGTGSEGSSFTVTGLAGKVVLAVYRAAAYKRAITTTPTDFEKVGIAGSDLGDRKGILSSTGVVSLSSGDGLVNGEILDFLIYE